MEILIRYAETLGISLLIIIIALMLWITPPKPWRYYWWGLGFVSPLLISLAFHFYFHNPGNYPVGLCLLSETARKSLSDIDADLNKISIQRNILKLKPKKNSEDDLKIQHLGEDLKVLARDQQALLNNKNDKHRVVELIIVHSGRGKNYYVEWDKEIKSLKLKENFVLQKTKTTKYKTIDCSAELTRTAKPYIRKKEPPLQWLYKNLNP